MEKNKLVVGKTYVVNLGYKYRGSKTKAIYKGARQLPVWDGTEELAIVAPVEVVTRRSKMVDYACKEHVNILVEFGQILEEI